MGDLATPFATQVALKKGFKHKHERKLLLPLNEHLFYDICANSNLLAGWDTQVVFLYVSVIELQKS
jgi:hypothetical protein